MARYDGECQHCFMEIFEGDDIGYLDDAIACESCLDEIDENDDNPFGGY